MDCIVPNWSPPTCDWNLRDFVPSVCRRAVRHWDDPWAHRNVSYEMADERKVSGNRTTTSRWKLSKREVVVEDKGRDEGRDEGRGGTTRAWAPVGTRVLPRPLPSADSSKTSPCSRSSPSSRGSRPVLPSQLTIYIYTRGCGTFPDPADGETTRCRRSVFDLPAIPSHYSRPLSRAEDQRSFSRRVHHG